MKKAVLIQILIILFFTNSFSQFKTTDDFDKFISYFKIIDSTEINTVKNERIPLELSKKIFGEELFSEHVTSTYTIGILNSNKNITGIIELGCPAAGYCASFYIFTFNNDHIPKTTILGSSLYQAFSVVFCFFSYYYDSILEVYSGSSEIDEYTDVETILTENYEYYLIDELGYKKVYMNRASKNRKYPISTTKLLKKNVIEKLSKQQLDIMRNEIFADKGYMFKTDKWKEYFSDKAWYNPKYEDVNNKISIIEKMNIQTILEVSSNKAE
jgi:hypothetical protein